MFCYCFLCLNFVIVISMCVSQILGNNGSSIIHVRDSNDKKCGILSTNSVEPVRCANLRPFICEHERVNSTCPGDFRTLDTSSLCYFVNYTNVTWDEARASCETLGAHLMWTFPFPTLQQITNLFHASTISTWVGCLHTTVDWLPVEGEPHENTQSLNWAPRNQMGDSLCIVIRESTLEMESRHNLHPFICEKIEADCLIPLKMVPPKIQLESKQHTRILGTNSSVWRVESGTRVILNCTSVEQRVDWVYPRVDQSMQPTLSRYILNDSEGKRLEYDSMQPSNAGVHRCTLWGQPNISVEMDLQVVNGTSEDIYEYLLPDVGSYNAVNLTRRWDDARINCNIQDDHLAVPRSKKELDALVKVANYVGWGQSWLGVRRTGTWAAVGGQKYDSASFSRLTTRTNGGRGDCLVLLNHELQDHPCTNRHSFFCRHVQANSSCRPGYGRLPGSGIGRGCYLLISNRLSWSDAREYCRRTQADLAIPDSQQVLYRMRDADPDPIWIGVHKINKEWTTVEGETRLAVNFTDWLPSDLVGDGDCVVLNGSEVSIADCTSTLPFICERNHNQAVGSLHWLTTLLISVLGVIAAISGVLWTKKHGERALRHNLLHGNWNKNTSESPFIDILQMLPYSERWEFPTRRLQLGKVIGAGEFGIVKKGLASCITPGQTVRTVAVKTVNKCADISCLKALVLEMKILSHLGQHLNVVNLLGACTMDLGKGKLQVILEYCAFGNVRSYLLHNRTKFLDRLDPITGAVNWIRNTCHQESPESSTGGIAAREKTSKEDMECEAAQTLWVSDTDLATCTLSTQDLMKWSYQIAKGMDYLTGRKVIHGDLAARNVLLTDNNVVKICDFGLARSLCDVAYYKKTGNDLLPIKWLAPEALLHQKFSAQSDVWAFGILLWELFTLGGSPYPGVRLSELYSRLQDGYRMDKPKMAPEEIYLTMQRCWLVEPRERPSFSVLVQQLGDLLEEGVVEDYVKLNDPYMKVNEANKDRDYLKDLPEQTFKDVSRYTSTAKSASARGPLPPIPIEETRV